MRIWTLIRILAAAVVLAVMSFTGMLAYHVNVKPVGGFCTRIIPEPGSINSYEAAEQFALDWEATEMPDIEPGEQAFKQAYELLALGELTEAREKLTAIFNIYPNSSVANTARKIVGEMNMDDLLGSNSMVDKSVHTVKRGDSYLAIAEKYNTTIDFLIHLNSMLELKGIQPGDELIVMPLDFHLVIEPQRQTVSLWKDGKFIREYPSLSMHGMSSRPQQTTVSQKIAEIDGRRVPSHAQEYRGANKILQLATPAVQIRSWTRTDESPDAPNGILLSPEDMEEVALLIRTGNKVEIR